jgi:AraC family transcriptional regulator of adaptative response/methylated-DNA-[protein]-cysteine methyltransferase
MSDYERIAQAISFITSRVETQPGLEEIAAHLHMSPFHFQRMFSRWAGVSPKRFLQALTLERAKQLLSQSKPLLEVSDALGLSSGSRLYDHFVQLEAVTPGEFKSGGVNVAIEHSVHDTPFGPAFIASTPKGICKLAFLDHEDRQTCLSDLNRHWPHAELHENPTAGRPIFETLFGNGAESNKPLSLHVSGTNFQINVWKALLRIPPARAVSYSEVAEAIHRPHSARAVGLAVGANPVALLIPCHRVIRQSGLLGGYRWGETRKHAIHAWEAARY